ncbi:MAG: hypothetical protein QXQ70_08510 [Candidatus Caldarchaeum sp.]
MRLWEPSTDVVAKSNMNSFMKFVDDHEGLGLDVFEKGSYFKLYQWSGIFSK